MTVSDSGRPKLWLRALITLFSAGWVFPMWWAAKLYLDHVRIAWAGPLSSFPFLEYSRLSLTVGNIWLGLVVAFWAWRR